jgi:hypothetical protein
MRLSASPSLVSNELQSPQKLEDAPVTVGKNMIKTFSKIVD